MIFLLMGMREYIAHISMLLCPHSIYADAAIRSRTISLTIWAGVL